MWSQLTRMMNCVRGLNSLSKLSILTGNNVRTVTTNSAPMLFQATNPLFAEPLKKKKKMDPMVIRMREERKKKRIEKRIRRLQKMAQQLKPIIENEVSIKLKDELPKRVRNLPKLEQSVIEEEMLLEKQWARYMARQIMREEYITSRMVMSQKKALEGLKEESLELYMSAISIDDKLMPCESNGPVYTPPITGYYQDGDYENVSKKFEGE